MCVCVRSCVCVCVCAVRVCARAGRGVGEAIYRANDESCGDRELVERVGVSGRMQLSSSSSSTSCNPFARDIKLISARA